MMPTSKQRLTQIQQILYKVYQDLTLDELNLRAMGLVYTTLLSLVPLLAVSFSVLKAFGVHNQLEPFLLNMLAPLGSKGEDISINIISFVENVKVGVLGSIGLAFLFYTIISLLQKIEGAFSKIWHDLPARRLLRRFSDYLSVILVGPVLVFAGLGVTASMVNNQFVQHILAIEPFGTAYFLIGQIIPYLLIIAAFTFVYIFIPNTRVKFQSALIGGILAGITWKIAGWAFTLFAAGLTSYDAIYSSFAILMMFMIWVYLSWLILLLGAKITFYYQNPQYLNAKNNNPQLSCQAREHLGLLIMQYIASQFLHGKQAPTSMQLAEIFSTPLQLIDKILFTLEKNQLLIKIQQDVASYFPARDTDKISLYEILKTLRCMDKDTFDLKNQPINNPPIDHLIQTIDEAILHCVQTRTLRDLIADEKSISIKKLDNN